MQNRSFFCQSSGTCADANINESSINSRKSIRMELHLATEHVNETSDNSNLIIRLANFLPKNISSPDE